MSASRNPDVPEQHDDVPLEGSDADFGFGRRTGTPARPAIDPLLNSTLGDVRLESLIAEGGMGRVYRGTQAGPNRVVAVKVIKPGTLSGATLRRFERESEVLGRLQHPGVTQVHACGTVSAEGVETAYFVMEYVAGARSITDYASTLELTGRQRVMLFREACGAMIHAHSRGIIHRDLKPGNILVSQEGHPKIIDFGVARPLDHDTILTTDCGTVGRFVGTIPYMAPEQFCGDSTSVDVRTDVYALGVVLYELLAGRPPFDLRQATFAQAARVVIEEDPPPISAFIAAIGHDVGRVIDKCLEKNPQRRYASVHALTADIDRFLRGEAVLARPSPLRDRLRRAWRRHPAPIAFAAGTLAVTLTFFGIAIVWQSVAAPERPSFETRVGSAPRARIGRTALSVAEARRLKPEQGMLAVDSPALSPEAAAVLAALNCHLAITVDRIDVEVAQALAKHRDGLAISGIRKLDDDVAAALAMCQGASLNLDSVERLSVTASQSLAGYSGWLNLNGPRTWPAGGLEAIATHVGGLSIGLAGISTEQAQILARHHGPLYVVGVEHIDEEAARALVAHAGSVDLWRADGITPAAAKVLRQRVDIRFPGR